MECAFQNAGGVAGAGSWRPAALLAVLLAAVLTAMAQLRPIMDSMATARVSNVITRPWRKP